MTALLIEIIGTFARDVRSEIEPAALSGLYRPESPASLEAREVGDVATKGAIAPGLLAIHGMSNLMADIETLGPESCERSVVPWMIGRAHLELAARAVWLLHPSLTPVVRVERSLALWFDGLRRDLRQTEGVVARIGEANMRSSDGHKKSLQATWRTFESRARALNIRVEPSGNGIRSIKRVGTTKAIGPTEMVRETFKDGPIYDFLSAMSHERPMTIATVEAAGRDSLVETFVLRKILWWFGVSSWAFYSLCGFESDEACWCLGRSLASLGPSADSILGAVGRPRLP